MIDGAITAFQGITDFIAGIFTGNWKDAFNGLKTFFSGWGRAVVGIIKTPINGIIGLINGAIDGINSLGLSIPDGVPFIGWKEVKMNIPKIPMLYKGTDNWMGGLAITQDRGGEIMDLPKGTRVYPHDESIKTAYQDGKRNGNNGLSINVTKLADKIEVRQDSDIDKIVDKMAQKLLTILENGGAIA